MSIQLELKVTSGKPIYRGHDHYWSVIRDLGKGGAEFTFAELAGRSNDPTNRSIGDYTRRLVKAGIIEVARTEKIPAQGGGLVDRNVYRLLRRPSKTPILNRDGSKGTQGLAQQHMWVAIRSLKQFDKHELALAAATEDVEIALNTALNYATHLFKAGYLLVVRSSGPGLPAVWRLKPSMNTGPAAPKILRSKMVYDANRREIMGSPIAEECAA